MINVCILYATNLKLQKSQNVSKVVHTRMSLGTLSIALRIRVEAGCAQQIIIASLTVPHTAAVQLKVCFYHNLFLIEMIWERLQRKLLENAIFIFPLKIPEVLDVFIKKKHLNFKTISFLILYFHVRLRRQ